MAYCPRCSNNKVVDPFYVERLQKSLAELATELIAFCKEKKIDHTDLPALREVGLCMSIAQEL